MAAWLTALIGAITSALTAIGTAIFEFIKEGFVSLFCEVTTTGTGDAAVTTITGPSIVAYFAFAMIGLTLALSLTKYVTSLIRCKRSA